MLDIEMRGITKSFPGVQANKNVAFSVKKGEIHALMGENGAGKSVLMSILSGLYTPDEGSIFLDGTEVHFSSPLDAIRAGIGMVFQEFQMFPSMTVAENVVFRKEPTTGGLINRAEAVEIVESYAQRFGLDVDPRMRVADAPVGLLQRAEIIKVLYRGAKVLILDEPTAVLTPQETDQLFDVLRQLKEQGQTIILITHKLREVMEISDRVTVLRDGQVVARMNTAEATPESVTHAMTGRDVDLTQAPSQLAPGRTVLEVKNLCVQDSQKQTKVRNLSLEVREGEILGIAGVAGNGQTELASAIAGLIPITSGSVSISGSDVTSATVRKRREKGLSYIPEDRQGVGAAPEASAEENLAMGHHRSKELTKRKGIIDRPARASFARRLIEKFSVKIANENIAVGTLSGGNLQKILIARELEYNSPLLVAEQPTRGVDIGAIEFIHSTLTHYRDAGGGILLISAELSEILSLSTRVAVMYEGEIVAEMPVSEATESKLGLLMAGGALGHED
ncbi:ABC transporter ATP-binding protein [Actinotignum sp. GS-2025b]|uniref:ABC transporter ATP-binding protein n=1 Tax=Actinotignum sp. GS-2025b TaxID=3427275 RepID=UPI003F47076E